MICFGSILFLVRLGFEIWDRSLVIIVLYDNVYDNSHLLTLICLRLLCYVKIEKQHKKVKDLKVSWDLVMDLIKSVLKHVLVKNDLHPVDSI